MPNYNRRGGRADQQVLVPRESITQAAPPEAEVGIVSIFNVQVAVFSPALSGRDPLHARRCRYAPVFLIYMLLLTLAVGLSVYAVMSGSIIGLLNGRDSFGTTCGQNSAGEWLTSSNSNPVMNLSVDATDLKFLYMFNPEHKSGSMTADLLTMCVAECPNIANIEVLRRSSLCIDSERLGWLDPNTVMENRIVSMNQTGETQASPSDLGCPEQVVPTVTVLQRCIPLTIKNELPFYIHVLDELNKLRLFGAALPAGICAISLLASPLLVGFVPSYFAFVIDVLLLIITAALIIYVNKTLVFSPPSATGNVFVDQTIYVNHWAEIICFGITILNFLGLVMRFGLVHKRMSKARPILQLAGRFWDAAMHFQAVATIVIILSIAGALLFGVLSLLGGCEFSPTLSQENLLVKADYGCDERYVKTTMWVSLVLFVWTTAALLALQATLVARRVIKEFAKKHYAGSTQPSNYCSCDLFVTCLRNPGQLLIDGFLLMITSPFRFCLVAGIPTKSIGVLRELTLLRFRIVELAMDRSTRPFGDLKGILVFLQRHQAFSDTAVVCGPFMQHVGSIMIAFVCWLSVLAINTWANLNIRYSEVFEFSAMAMGFLIGTIILMPIQVCCDTLALLVTAGECSNPNLDHNPYIGPEIKRMLQQSGIVDGIEMRNLAEQNRSNRNISQQVNIVAPVIQMDGHQPARTVEHNHAWNPLMENFTSGSHNPPVRLRTSNRASGPYGFHHHQDIQATGGFSESRQDVGNGQHFNEGETAEGNVPEYEEVANSANDPSYASVDNMPTVERGRGHADEGDSRDSMFGICKVCMVEAANQLLLPCKHMCLCAECLDRIKSTLGHDCPICRGKIESSQDVILS